MKKTIVINRGVRRGKGDTKRGDIMVREESAFQSSKRKLDLSRVEVKKITH